jgi:hypothetical protein
MSIVIQAIMKSVMNFHFCTKGKPKGVSDKAWWL